MRGTMRQPAEIPERRLLKVIIKVGYAWSGTSPVQDDSGWTHIRDFARERAKEAGSRLKSMSDIGKLDAVAEVRRLRATAGRPITERIIEAVDEADILIFDISDAPCKKCPDPSKGLNCPNPNVCIEMGIALAKGKQMFLIKEGSHKAPSNLQGFYVSSYEASSAGKLPMNKDPSLRASLVSAILRAFCARNGMSFDAVEDWAGGIG